MKLTWPWQDGKLGFSWLKAGTFALMFVPAIWMLHDLATGQFGPVPLGGLTYWSGVWATAFLLLALAVTPAVTILRWRRLIVVRRMIGVTGLVYAIAHIIVYFALRFWDFAFIAREIVTRLSLIVATISTIGLIALGATSVDAAVRRMGARGWQQLHTMIYVVTALALLHYLLSPGLFPDQFLMSGMFFWLMVWRKLDRHGHGANIGALALLAVTAAIFTAVLEVGSIWAFRGYALSEIFSIYFTPILGIPPPWTILVLGLLITVATFTRQALRLWLVGLDAGKIG